MTSKRVRILTVFGTRPEAIKMAPVIRALHAERDWCDVRICVTAQHRQMLDPFLELFEIVPDHDLDLMRENQTLAGLTARLFETLGSVIAAERPDWLLVQGDTTTAMVAAMSAFYARVRVGHVEAGLRTNDRHHPFPEEINRRVISRVTDLHFAPTESARRHLLNESIADADIVVTGNTAIDAVRWAVDRPVDPEVDELVPPAPARLLLVTTHRRENFGAPLERICLAIREIGRHYGSSVRILLPVHLNPQVDKNVRRLLADCDNVRLLPPVSYLTLVHLMQRSHFVLTDSGGIQEEAPSLGKPVLVLRDYTERTEGVEAGTTLLVGTDVDRIVTEARRLLDDRLQYERMARVADVFGDGHAADRIVTALKHFTRNET